MADIIVADLHQLAQGIGSHQGRDQHPQVFQIRRGDDLIDNFFCEKRRHQLKPRAPDEQRCAQDKGLPIRRQKKKKSSQNMHVFLLFTFVGEI